MKKTLTMISFFLACTLVGCNNSTTSNNENCEYNITYHLDGGNGNDNPTIYTDTMGTIKLIKPNKTSCTFKGWYTDSNFTNQITQLDNSIDKDMNLYAK